MCLNCVGMEVCIGMRTYVHIQYRIDTSVSYVRTYMHAPYAQMCRCMRMHGRMDGCPWVYARIARTHAPHRSIPLRRPARHGAAPQGSELQAILWAGSIPRAQAAAARLASSYVACSIMVLHIQIPEPESSKTSPSNLNMRDASYC